MFSEQFFDLCLNFGDDWKVDDVKVNFKSDEVDIYVSYIADKADCPESLESPLPNDYIVWLLFFLI